jgi:hypothetical protein
LTPLLQHLPLRHDLDRKTLVRKDLPKKSQVIGCAEKDEEATRRSKEPVDIRTNVMSER